MANRRGLLHINLNVSSLDRSVRFYRDALGFREVERREEIADLGSGPEKIHQAVLTIPRSETILALTHAASLPVGPGGLNHVGLILEADVECTEIVARVEALGGAVQKRGRREEDGVAEEFAYVRDPDGYAIELSTQAILYERIG
ncbi:VOC family protein [Myxococcota bacterium]|nr:VOC family protein [Myxococcota bacterium]